MAGVAIATTKKLTRSQASIAAKVKRWQKTLARAKALYDRADRMLIALSTKMKLGVPTPINGEGKHAVLLDNYAGKEIVWGHGGVRRWAIDIVDLSE